MNTSKSSHWLSLQSASALAAVLFLYLFLVTPLYAQVITSLKRASLAPQSNRQGQSYSYDPNISGDGRYVLFTSTADNFAASGNTAGQVHEHVYMRDTLLGQTTQLDVTSSGRTGAPGISFNPNTRVFRSSFHPHFSRDGTYVVFLSSASNISPDGLNETFGSWAYLKNIATGIIQRIPFVSAGDDTKSEYPANIAISGDGAKVVVISIISNITDVDCSTCVWKLTVYDRNSNTTIELDTGISGNKFNPQLTDDGRFLVFENQVGDFNGPTYSYLYDFSTAQVIALNESKISDSPAISGDGNFIAYSDTSSVPTRIRLRERASGTETLVSDGLNDTEPNGISEFPSLSIDGRYIAFLSTASNLVTEDTNGSDDIFVFDRILKKSTLVSVQGACSGTSTREDFNTGPPSISSDGKTLTFAVLERLTAADQKNSSGVITERADTNSFDDIYVATLDYDAVPDFFRTGLTPLAPFVSVNCTGAVARVLVEGVSKTSFSIKSISNEVLISKVNVLNGRRVLRKKLITKRNQITTRGLSAGTYSVQTRALAKLNNGKIKSTRLSRSSKFVITR